MSETSFQFIVRVAATDLRGDWPINYALQKIKGVGPRLARTILEKLEIPLNLRAGYLTEEDVTRIEDILAKPTDFGIPSYMVNRQRDLTTGEDMHLLGNDLATYLKRDLDRMKKTRSIRGIRHSLGLTVRGQRTRTSGRGKGRTVGVQRKKR